MYVLYFTAKRNVTFTAQFVSSFLEMSFSDLLSRGKGFTEKLRTQTGNELFKFLSEQQPHTSKGL